MARGKYLSLEEARKDGTIKRFCKEHPSKGDKKAFDRLFNAMASGKPNVPSSSSHKIGGDNGKDTDKV